MPSRRPAAQAIAKTAGMETRKIAVPLVIAAGESMGDGQQRLFFVVVWLCGPPRGRRSQGARLPDRRHARRNVMM